MRSLSGSVHSLAPTKAPEAAGLSADVAAAGHVEPMHWEPSSQISDLRVATGLRHALSEMEHLRAENQLLRSDKMAQQDAQMRLETKNMDLWDQVRDCRGSIDTLSQQLQVMQEAMRSSAKSAVRRAPALGIGHNAVSTSTGFGSSPAQSLSSPTTPPSPASPLSLLARPGGEADAQLPGLFGPPPMDAGTATWPAVAEPPSLWPQRQCGGSLEVGPATGKIEPRDEGALSAQLFNLKAQMAAVEAQGESLRAATRAVEEEYRRMVTTSSWPGAAAPADGLGGSVSAIAAVPSGQR